MNSHLSSHAKLGLSWERFYLGLCYWISIPLKCWLKYAACNVDKIDEKTTLVSTEFGPEIGFLASEGYPYRYPRNTYRISTYPIPEGWSMNIYFKDFDVEKSPDCV